MASDSEEEFRKLTVELRFLEQTAEAIQSRINMVNAVATDLTYASVALEGLGKEKEGTELLVPVGGNSHVRATLANSERVIIGMGAGVSVEKTMSEAKEIVKNRLADMEKTRLSLQQQFAKVAENIKDDREKLQGIISTLKEGKAPSNV